MASARGLPFGPFDPLAHRTFEIGLRAWVEAQTGLRLGYVEQLYTFGDRGRHAEPGDTGAHMVSVGYLALTRADGRRGAQRAGASFEPWYRFFPWEDWREERPAIIDRDILPALTSGPEQTTRAHARARPRGSACGSISARRRALGRGARARPLRTPLRGRA